ncbi:DUF2065 domain-containing protein [Pleionea litopenaei]|uniref:DUF2065 domain-containing protein n=1 Tax=Pleionea litopenaei TaxID=3070815 RepID=A0AA51RWV6_9GAMM|nr:DUF2065 domain-containing protein [Pleionea sp. HL-JVS1]WMS88984.1 DUF2065 domain-containing protein [Pleionea sp. HL-JVS1]
MHSILTAIALMMVFEGILPFVNPQLWRAAMLALAAQSDANLRYLGAALMLSGIMVAWSLASF